MRLRRSAAARRFTLSLRPGADGPTLTLPARASEAEARRFLDRHRDWLRGALARAPAPLDLVPGARLPVGGRLLEVVSGGVRRGCRLEGDRLLVPQAGAGPAAAAFLKAEARAAIAPAAAEAAATLGRRVARVSFRDTRSRWGSCTSEGALAFSWRLAMAPPAVQRYVAIHEAAHLVEMNHGPDFWRLVEGLDPAHRAHRLWLRREGPALHRWRF